MPLYLTLYFYFFFFTDTATPEIYTLSLHDALPIWLCIRHFTDCSRNLSGSHLILDFSIWPNLTVIRCGPWWKGSPHAKRSEERRVGKECRYRWSQEHEKKKSLQNMETVIYIRKRVI